MKKLEGYIALPSTSNGKMWVCNAWEERKKRMFGCNSKLSKANRIKRLTVWVNQRGVEKVSEIGRWQWS